MMSGHFHCRMFLLIIGLESRYRYLPTVFSIDIINNAMISADIIGLISADIIVLISYQIPQKPDRILLIFIGIG